MSKAIKWRGQCSVGDGGISRIVKCCRQCYGMGSRLSCGVELCGHQDIETVECQPKQLSVTDFLISSWPVFNHTFNCLKT